MEIKILDDGLPEFGYVRQAELIRPKGPLPFSATTLWRKVKKGTFPAPEKISDRVSAFCVIKVRAWKESPADYKADANKAA